jgi:hypothetical protein
MAFAVANVPHKTQALQTSDTTNADRNYDSSKVLSLL